MNISKFDLILTSWPSYLTFDLEKLYTSVSAKDTYVGQVWWWYVKAFVSYRRTHRQTDRQTNTQTNRQTNILANFFEILASNNLCTEYGLYPSATEPLGSNVAVDLCAGSVAWLGRRFESPLDHVYTPTTLPAFWLKNVAWNVSRQKACAM